MKDQFILFGAGSGGRYVLKHLASKSIFPVCFADNDQKKWLGTQDGVLIMDPEQARIAYPDAVWVACALKRPGAKEIREQIAAMGVRSKPLWECLPVCHGVPPETAKATVANICYDLPSKLEFYDQISFRNSPNYGGQLLPSDVNDIYFPEFISHRDDEHFIDCGAADGDTVQAFKERWKSFRQITAFEPDPFNLTKLRKATWADDRVLRFDKAISDHKHEEFFTASGDYSSHLGGGSGELRVGCWRLDDIYLSDVVAPTFIKMDIEGSELEALWGARKVLKKHSPVLAICAYHTSDHLWQIPLLIHAIQPDYKLFLRRYAEGALELVWYAVPPERVIDDNERIKEERRQMHRIAVSDFDCPV
jgi:FkbM family methyltransferase